VRVAIIFGILLLVWAGSRSELRAQPFSRTDSLHGSENGFTTCYNVLKYDIRVRLFPNQKAIRGTNSIVAKVIGKAILQTIQLDLFSVIKIDSILFEDKKVSFTRDSNIFLVHFPKKLIPGQRFEVKIFFNGIPPEAKNAPWDGGFVWAKDARGNPWVGLACEGIGASCWLPCKDHLNDEPEDGVEMRLIVPEKSVGVSNGRLVAKKQMVNQTMMYHWRVTSPINPYNISINVGNYAHLSNSYTGAKGKLSLDYYVLTYNADTAQKHFKQVQGMLSCFEKYFGPYPFWSDGYKLVETPYWGMEHQSCVAYGNNYKNNTWGFDFIIIHESGHEYFGNSLSMADAAEMWIHESFTTYSETIYMECLYGKEKAFEYLSTQRKNIKNLRPMIGPFGVYYHGREDNDIYYKGAWVLQTLREAMNNDSLFLGFLKHLTMGNSHENITTREIITQCNQITGINWDVFFNQYLYYSTIPVFEYRVQHSDDKWQIHYRLRTDVAGLSLPMRFTIGKTLYKITVGNQWQTLQLIHLEGEQIFADNSHVLVEVLEVF
jgi:aminopeptidase N